MKKKFTSMLCVFLVLTSLTALAHAKKVPAKRYQFTEQAQPAPPPAELASSTPLASTASDTFNLGWFSFDVAGTGDPQGWTTVDLTDQLIFWHVASGTGELNGGNLGNLLPLEGVKSMWCGQAPSSSPLLCGWATLPGYGNGWDQILVSNPLPGDSVRISYKVFWDSEPDYDGTTVEYTGDGGATWMPWPVGVGFTARPNVYDGGPQTLVESFTAGALTTVQLRYRFRADGAWSDEDGLWPTDGGVLVDSITVTTWAGGVQASTNFEDFEGAAEGDTVVGIWTATVPEPFGDFGALYHGTTLLQEDPCFTDITSLWAWFDDPAITNYNCHLPDPRPDVGAVRFGDRWGDGGFIANEIWSPQLANIGTGNEYRLEFLTYRDLPLDNLIFYIWSVRSIDASGCPSEWKNDNFVFFGGQKDWIRNPFQVGAHIDPTAPEIQVSIGVRDMCIVWCNLFGVGGCHSHAPLIDAVHLKRVDVIGPRFVVRHIDLFQDNFSSDGTITGTALANSANDIASTSSPTIQPGDSVTLSITNLVPDPLSGMGPAAYAYVAVWPQGQVSKAGVNIEAPETRLATGGGAFGKRWPLVASPMLGGVQWYQFRMDTAFTRVGAALADRFAIDLNDNLFTPGDTICYFFGGSDGLGNETFFHRTLSGQGANNITDDILEAASSPMEFTILPAGGFLRGGHILYVDDTDDRGGPAQLYFDTAFDFLQMLDMVDRYDVLGPSSGVSNSLGARVQNTGTQIIGPYRTIIWNSGNLSSTLINDGGVFAGGGSADKSPDFSLIFEFLDTHPNNPGFYYSADDGPSDWAWILRGANAVNTRSIYMNFDLDPAAWGDHKLAGEPLSPVLDGVGPATLGEQLIAFGGCPTINDFDLLLPTGSSGAEMINSATGKTYMVSQSTLNAVGTAARVVLSGFSFHYIRDVGTPGSVPARVTHLKDILTTLFNIVPPPTGFDGVPQYTNALEPNYPNPFNPTTHITFEIKTRGHVTLRIYNVAGQVVRTLVNEELAAGRYENRRFNVWDGTNDAGQEVGSGVYFYRLKATNFTQTRKLVLLK